MTLAVKLTLNSNTTNQPTNQRYFSDIMAAAYHEYISMDEGNIIVSAYTLYRHLQQYCSHPSICRPELHQY